MKYDDTIYGISAIALETFRSGGPGGQHQNTAETGVRLRATVSGKRLLERLRQLYPSQVTDDGELLVESRAERSRHQNMKNARAKLEDMVAQARKRPKRRKKTRPTRASKERRLQSKKHRSYIKELRKDPNAPR